MKTTREELIRKIKNYFEENEDSFNTAIVQLDEYSGFLEEGRYYQMGLLDDFYCSATPTEIFEAAYYGHDEDDFTTDGYGSKHYTEFNPNREYFGYNGYGNLVSTNYPDYSVYLDDCAVEKMLDNRRWVSEIEDNDELSKLFDELENWDEDEDDEEEE